MRKQLAALAGAMVLVPSIAILAASPAAAQCPGKDGSIPGQPARVVQVGPHPNTIYIDDRDFADANDNGDAGGLWVYSETGRKVNLQRGGDQIAFTVLTANGVNPNVPRVNPIVIPAPGTPVTRPNPALFPNGFGGGSLSATAGFYDDCLEGAASERDNILF